MTAPRPPRWARWLVAALVRSRHREWILGDLEEMYGVLASRRGPGVAVPAYLLWGFRSGLAEAVAGMAAGGLGDVRSALRQFRAHPRVYGMGSAVLAVGLGVATFVWGVFHGTFGTGLPVQEPHRMVAVQRVDGRTGEIRDDLSADDLALVRRVPALEAAGLWGSSTVTWNGGDGPPERVEASRLSPSVFELLEARPHLGRILVAADARPGAPPVVVLGHRFWMRRYDGRADVLGRTIRIDGSPTEVVGVLPEGRSLLHGRQHEEIYLPVGARGDRSAREYRLLARAARGVGIGEISERLAALAPDMGGPGASGEGGSSEATLRAVPFAESFQGGIEDAYGRVLALVGTLLFLLSVANAANLFVVRAMTRSRELAVRRALGAGGFRILRQIALEASVPAVLGILGGALIASGALHWYQGAQELYAGGDLATWHRYGFGGPHVVRLAVGALLGTVMISVVAGAVELRRGSGEALREGRGTTARLPFARGLMALEVTVGGALLLLASLMVRGGWNLRTQEWGFAVEGVVTGHVVLDTTAYPGSAARVRFWRELEERLAGLPGVESATLATQIPMIRYGGPTWAARRPIQVEGRDAPEPELPTHYVDAVSPTYFGTFGARLLAGRSFGPDDAATAEPVAVVNAAFAEAFFADGRPLGRRIRIWTEGEAGPWRTVVGIAPDLWMDSDENRDPEGVYVPLTQSAPVEATLAVRASGAGDQIFAMVRGVLAELDPRIPVDDLMSMSDVIRQRTRLYRRDAPLFVSVGLAAFLLAVAGTYVVVSYLASLRRSEFGIRAALGARRLELVGRALRSAVPPVAVGAGTGTLLGLILVRGFERFLFEVDPADPLGVLIVCTVLLATTLGAGLVPALRSGRVDLRELLRTG